MRLKLTLTLLAILLGLLTYIFYIDNRSDGDELAQSRSSVLGDLAVGIDTISIQNNATGQAITLEYTDKRWMLREPYAWPANEFAVERILTELRFLERISSFETDVVSNSGVSLDDYGLRPPRIALQLGRGGQRHTLGIGKPTEIGDNLYLLSTDQSHVHVVDRSLLDAISVDLDTLRSGRLFDIAVFEATSWNIQVRENNRNLRAWFARNGDDWVFQTPISARADSAAVNTLLSRCLNLEAESIVAANPTDLSPYGLQTPHFRIAIESSQLREVLEIGERIAPDSDLRYAKRESRPTVFQLRIDFLDLLANAQTKLRERRIFEIDTTAATTVTIERRDQQPLSLQKLEGGSWEIVVRDQGQGIQTFKGDSETIEEILVWLNELKAVPDTGFVNDAPSAPDLESYGLEVPEYAITITSNRRHDTDATLPTPESETLYIGDPTERDPMESFVKIESKDFVYSVYNDFFSRIDNAPERYQDRQVIDLPDEAFISKITLTRIGDGEIIADYTLDENADETARALARALSNLSAESYNPGGFTRTVEIAGRERPWAYWLTAEVQRSAAPNRAPERIELFISETTGGPLLHGGLPTRNLSFRFRTEFIDAFSPIVFERSPRPTPEDPFSDRPLPATEDAPGEDENRFEAAPSPEPADATE